MAGIRTTNLERQFAIDELIGNITDEGVEKTARIPIDALTHQLAGSGPFIFGNTVYALTRAALVAYTPASETSGGVVLNDPDPTKNGYYARQSAAWVRGRGFPDALAVLTQTGGTANALQLMASDGVDPAQMVVGIVVPDGTNGGPATIAINGAAAVPLLSAAGAPLGAGELVGGKATIIAKIEGDWRVVLAYSQFTFRSAWSSATNYVGDDIVQYGGSLWLANRQNVNVTPVEGADWTLFLPGVTVADGSVTEPKHATGGVSTRALAGQSVTTPKLADEAVTIQKVAAAVLARIDASRPSQGRCKVDYWSTSQVVAYVPDALAMNGFRMFGNNFKHGRPVFSTGGAGRKIVSIIDDIAYENVGAKANPYAVFAVANDGDDTCSFVLAPYLRVLSVAGNVVTLAAAGENKNVTPEAKTYDMNVDVLAGADCLIVNEGSNWGGRVATITANTTTTVTLDDAGSLAQLNYLLPAPPSWDEYVYLGTAIHDVGGSAIGGDFRNIADTGTKVEFRGINVSEFPANGAISNQKVRLGGMISPLATAVLCSVNFTISTTSLGNIAMTLSHDSSSHDVFRMIAAKEASANLPFNQMAEVCFSREQAMWANTTGTLPASMASATCLVYGWLEP